MSGVIDCSPWTGSCTSWHSVMSWKFILPVQKGEETSTEMASFLLCGDRQLHDLHSKLLLEHPRGTANQLHK